MTSHFTGTIKNRRWSHRKQRLKRCIFRRLRKTGSEGADVRCGGRPFQIRAAATGKARSPMVDNRVQRTTSDDDEADRWGRCLSSPFAASTATVLSNCRIFHLSLNHFLPRVLCCAKSRRLLTQNLENSHGVNMLLNSSLAHGVYLADFSWDCAVRTLGL